MSTATLSNQRINRPNMTAIGTIVWLSSELMFFAALFAMYFTLRAVNPDIWKLETEMLNIPFSGGDKERLRLWFITTFLMGAFFVGGQAYEYSELVLEGLTISSSPFGSVFYITTGFHALHVTGGLVAFLFVLARSYVRPKMTQGLATSAVVTSYYWHFVDVVWIGLFATIYLVK